MAQDGGRLTLDEGDRASLLHGLLEVFGAETGDGLRKTDPDTDMFNPRGITRKVFSGQGPNVLLNHLLARIRKYNKRGHPSECFWKYCV
nr:urotensin-2 [Desmodus rotundus]